MTSEARRILVAKSGGGLEPFDVAKVRRCLTAAMRACNCGMRFASPLARAVELHLRDWVDPRPPTTDYIFRCLRTALSETGMERVAQELIRHRRNRSVRRKSVTVYRGEEAEQTPLPWRKGKVAGRLESEHGIGHATARILAGEIERRVLALEYTVVSKALIAELLRNELMAWGLTGDVTSTSPKIPGATAVIDRQATEDF